MLTLNPPLGTSDLIPTRIAYGCWRLAGSEGGPRVEPEDGKTAFLSYNRTAAGPFSEGFFQILN